MRPMIDPIGDGFAVEVSGVDLSSPVPDDVIAEIEASMDRCTVLMFHDQPLTDDEIRDFTRRFGPLEAASGGHVPTSQDRRLPLDLQDASIAPRCTA
jgi:alpha-ketoglutarate-dependent 2,4-dichlorophenoxyacetate dioxygenase